MAKNVISKNYTLPVSWDDRRYSDQDGVPTFSAPSLLTATAGSGTITISFTDNTSGAARHRIYRSTDNITFSSLVVLSAGVTSYEDDVVDSSTYYYRATAVGASDEETSASNTDSDAIASGNTLLFSNGFEADLTGFSSPSGTAAYARVTNDPDTGSYCVRGNFIGNKADSIAGITGSGNTINLVVPDLRANTPDACVLRYRYRIDPATYLNDTAGIPYIKAGYFSDTSVSANTVDAFFTSIDIRTGRIRFIGRNSTWLNGTLSGWPASNIYFATTNGGAVNTFDGEWHTFEIRFDYINRHFRIFIDDLPVYGATYFTDGLFNLGSSYHFDQARIFYASSVDVRLSTDGPGIAGGWQIDNFTVYDGPA